MAFHPNQFLSNIKSKGGLAKPSRFQVILPLPNYINDFVSQSLLDKFRNLSQGLDQDIADIMNNVERDAQAKSANPTMSRYLALQCESAELPGKTLATADVKIYGPTFKVPYQTQYNETTLTFVCTNEFYERKLFDRWLEAIMPTDTNNMRFAKGAKSRYMTNIQVVQYDDYVKQIYAVELIDAFPIGISSQPLSWAEDGFHRVSVQFSYQKYRTIYNSNNNTLNVYDANGLPTINPLTSAVQNVNQKVGNFLQKLF